MRRRFRLCRLRPCDSTTTTATGSASWRCYDNNVGSWYAYSLQTGQATILGRSWGWPGGDGAGDYDGDAFSDMAV
jgi:hypothetical protein